MATAAKRAVGRANGRGCLLSQEEGRELFDRQARKLRGMSGDEFLRRWDAGEFADIADDPDHPDLMHLAMLIPFGG